MQETYRARIASSIVKLLKGLPFLAFQETPFNRKGLTSNFH